MRLSELSVQHRHVKLNGTRLHFVEKGHGPLVLLLHGFPETWWGWRYQIEALATAGFHVVALDLRGFGESELGGKLSMNELAADVRGLLAHLDETRTTLVGHDWGGGVAWHVAATAPQLCERLIILNCHHAATFHRLVSSPRHLKATLFWQFFRLPFVPDLLFSRTSFPHKLMRSTAIDTSHFSVEETAPDFDAMKRPGAIGSMLQYYRSILFGEMRRPDFLSTYKRITAPTLVVWAMEDSVLRYVDAIDDIYTWVESPQLVQIERCGHFVAAEQPEQVNAADYQFSTDAHCIDWLKSSS